MPLFAAGFTVFLLLAALTAHLPLTVAALSLGASALLFVLYGLDKSAARRGARRTPENTLHLWSLLGGWPGAVAGQRAFRHKSSKAAFLRIFRLTAAIHCALVGWALSPPGRQLLQGWW